MSSDNSEVNSNSFKKNLLSLFKNSFKRKEKAIFDSNSFEKLDIRRQDMIKGVFRLSQQNAREIMIPRVDIKAVDSATEFKSLVKLVYEGGHSRLPVFEDTIDNIIGMLYAKDLLTILIEKSKKKFQLKKILHEPYFVPETMPLDELMLEFRIRKQHIAIVLDEYGGVAGIVTLEDILEEIVGEIHDEFDIEELPTIEKLSKNSYEIDSRMPISELNETLKLDLPTEEFDTIGGYIFDIFGKIPEKDEEIAHDNISYKIKDVNGTIINRIIVTLKKSK